MGELVKVFVLRAEFCRLLGLEDEAIQSAQKGMKLVPKLNKKGIANASGMMLHWTLVLIWVKRGDAEQAKAEMKELDRCPRPCDAFDLPLKLWKHSLRRNLD